MEIIKQEKRNIVNQIQKLIDESLDVYSSIFSVLPTIEDEVYLTTHEVEILLDFFLHNDEKNVVEGKEVLHLALVLKKVFDEIEEASHDMVDEKEFLQIMERFIDNGEDNDRDAVTVQNLMHIIPIIKSKISDIELISMNAIIFSAKLGEQGKAFEVISDNIMNLSNRVAFMYDGIEKNALELKKWNDQFSSSLEEIVQYHKRLTNEHLRDFNSMHTKVFDSLKAIRDLFYGMIISIQKSVEPVHVLMTQLQQQDIIQQSMENLIKILNYFEDDEYMGKDNIKKLHLYKNILNLSVGLVENIENNLAKSIQEIEETIDGAKKYLHDMLEEGGILVDIICGRRENQNNVIQRIFHDVDKFLLEFNSELSAMNLETEGFKATEDAFKIQMRGVEKKISNIKKAMEQLNKLNLMSRIELSRINNRDSLAFVSEITNISKVVRQEVHNNDEFISRLRVQLEKDLKTFLFALSNNQDKVMEMQKVIFSASDQMEMAKNLVMEAIYPIGYAGRSLDKEIELVSDKFEKGKVMFDWLQEIKVSLLELEQKVSEQLETQIDKHGSLSIDVEDDSFKRIIDSMTTHYERSVLNLSLNDQVVDEGTDGGDLTLF